MEWCLTNCTNETEWNALVEASAQGSIFSDTRYLRALGVPFTCYLVREKNGRPLAGAAVLEDRDGMCAAPFAFTPYQGIFFCNYVTAQSNHKRVLIEFRISEFFIKNLVERYGNFSMSLSPEFKDLRPFLWYNHNILNAAVFSVKNRYSATLNLSNFKLDDYLKTVRASRRQELRKSAAVITESDNIKLFLDLYIKTFERQGILVDRRQIELVERISNQALSNGFGRLGMAETVDGVASMSLFIYDSRRAYYLFGANDPELRNSGSSTALMFDNINAMAGLGVTALDFVGVNSPNRGDFKLSFNPVLTQYHEVNLVHSVHM